MCRESIDREWLAIQYEKAIKNEVPIIEARGAVTGKSVWIDIHTANRILNRSQESKH